MPDYVPDKVKKRFLLDFLIGWFNVDMLTDAFLMCGLTDTLSVCVCLSVCLFVFLCVCLCIYLSVRLSDLLLILLRSKQKVTFLILSNDISSLTKCFTPKWTVLTVWGVFLCGLRSSTARKVPLGWRSLSREKISFERKFLRRKFPNLVFCFDLNKR